MVIAPLGRAPAPKGLLVECQVLLGYLTVDIRAHISVADGQGALFPYLIGMCPAPARRLVIPQAQGVSLPLFSHRGGFTRRWRSCGCKWL